MRQRTFIVLLLLAAFGLGFATGLHPCGAEERERESPPASCHEAASTGGAAVHGSVPPSDDEGQGCCETVCPHACHMPAAVAGVRPTAFAELVSQLAARGSGRVLPPLAHLIDHVPLV